VNPEPNAQLRQLSHALWAAGEPFVLGILFTPEGRTALTDLGVRPEAGYFAVRAAPLGRASSAVAAAAFHGFPAAMIGAILTPVWDHVAPGDVIAAHQGSIPLTAARVYGDTIDGAQVSRLADLLTTLVADLDTAGRPLAAGNQAVEAPSEPWARFWQASTTLREYRGDGHIAALVSADLNVVESLVLTAAWAAGHIDTTLLRSSRRLSDEAWKRATDDLAARNLLTADGDLTDEGRAVRDDIEDRTDQAATRPWSKLTPERGTELYGLLTTLSRGLIDAGNVPSVTPVGAPWPPPDLTA
jgi:hypothetical protein